MLTKIVVRLGITAGFLMMPISALWLADVALQPEEAAEYLLFVAVAASLALFFGILSLVFSYAVYDDKED